MYLTALLILLSLTCSGPAGASEQGDREPARNTAPMFKGVEVYSWKDSKSGEWCFSLLPGTNRMKTYREVTDPLFTKKGADALKETLATFAIGEQVFWFNTIDKMQPVENPRLTFPPEAMVKELSDYCATLKIHLNYPASGSKQPLR